jgi:hypothetical protein
MSSPLDPLQLPRIDPLTPMRRVDRQQTPRDQSGRQHSDEPDEDEEDEEDGLHVDVLA